MPRLTMAGKVAALLVVAGGAVAVVRIGLPKLSGLAPEAQQTASVIPSKADLPGMNETSVSIAKNIELPSGDIGCPNETEVRLLGYAWNAQMGMLFANGGAQATKGSLMCKHNVNFKFDRQDDNGKLQEALVAFASALKNGDQQPKAGAHFVTIMGDGSAAFLEGLNATLAKLGPEYRAKIVGSIGYSRGEDKFMGPKEWRDHPDYSKGGVVAGVIRDGDWNIAQKWLGDNGLKNNPSEKTYDPDALNWINASDYLDAASKYITGYSEERPVVKNGKKTGETKRITVNAVVTWTPGDVNIAKQKGGIVSIVSTHEYSTQMPCVVIGIDRWMKSNKDVVENMLLAIAEGGDAVKGNPAALQKAAEVSSLVYHEKDSGPEYWAKYYKGTREADKMGQEVDLGGSYANNLADSLYSFGLVPGSANLFQATYEVFGNIVKQQYPDLLAKVAPYDSIADSTYYRELQQKYAPSNAAVASATPSVAPKADAKQGRVISSKIWRIPFETGKANFSSAAYRDLNKLRQDLLVASSTTVEIHGHTDSAGSADANQKLSEDRAFAVQRWLEKQFPQNFPAGRVKIFAHGSTNPLQSNGSAEGRAANRRVEIKIIATGE